MKRATFAGLVAAVLVAACAAPKVPHQVPDEEGGEPRAASEPPVKLPPYPKEQDLVRFEVQPRTAFEYFVDGTSIALDDGVVRFTVVARTASAVNVSYEGFRCISRERRVYAHTRRDGAWVVTKDPGWTSVGPRETAGFRHELYWNYFCPGKRIISSTREGVDALRFGGHPDARPEGSMTGGY